jgi:hypothetical protein
MATESTMHNNTPTLLAILIAMGMQWYNGGRIAWKPLDTTIGQVPGMYCPGGHHCQRVLMRHKNNNKTQLLASNYHTFFLATE